MVRADLGPICQPGLISQLLGFDVSQFRHVVTSQRIAHTLKKHGNAKTEALRGQIAVTVADFSRLRQIMKPRARIMLSAERGKHGEPRLEIRKRIGGVSYTYVAEVHRGKRRVESVTMWKRPS